MKFLFRALAGLLSLVATSAYALYLPSGPQTDVSLSTVTSGGWTECYAATMDVYIGNNAENVLNKCSGDYIMMAGRATGSDTFLVLAATTLAEAIYNTGANSSNTHLSNGSNWYFAPNWSWGFTDAADSVSLSQCDTSDSPTSMCLHTINNAGGYRINNITSLNNSTAYEKVFFVASANKVPEPGTLALLGLGLIGAQLIRRRK